MIRKLCPVCSKVIDRRHSLCEECSVKMTSKRNKEYNQALRNKDNDSVYQDPRWKRIKQIVHLRDKGKCRLCFENKTFRNLQMVHHIIEPEENMDLVYEKDNLISLCESCHQRVHSEYRKGNRNETILRLQRLATQTLNI